MSTLSVRRPLSVVAVVAMVATMLFAVAGTASAASPDSLADYTACPANAGIPDAGFTDVASGSFFDDAINCIAYYGVTKGTSDTTYSPAAAVIREHMALFLTRLASSAGVSLAASPPSAGFTDIAGLSSESQLAINQLAAAGVVQGTSTTTYSPAAVVSREHMALFLTRFLGKAIVGPGGTALSSAATSGSPFTDIAGTTYEAHIAINQVWDLGVTTGTTATKYSPSADVTREQMAAFLTRLAAHMNTRPAGVNIQATPLAGFGTFATSISVTARTTGFLPSASTYVDIWRFDPSSTVTTPFNTNGICNLASNLISKVQGGSNACTLEVNDPSTDPNGNVPVFSESAIDGKGSSFYAWTGAAAATFDDDTTAHSMVTIGSTTGAVAATFKTDLPRYSDGVSPSYVHAVKFGTTVTLTVQLVDIDGDPVAEAGVPYTFSDAKTVNGVGATSIVREVLTDASGKATYTVTQADPMPPPADSDYGENIVTVTLGSPGVTPTDTITLNWVDDTPVATTLIADPTGYKTQGDNVANTTRATLYDQYGNTMANKSIGFTSMSTGDRNEVVTFQVATDGDGSDTFMLTFGGDQTLPIVEIASAATVQAELVALASIGAGNVVVTGAGTTPDPWVIEFTGALGAQDISGLITAAGSETGTLIISALAVSPDGATGLAEGIGTVPFLKQTNNVGVAILTYTWDWATSSSVTGEETIAVVFSDAVYDTTVFYWVDEATAALNDPTTVVLVADVDNDTVVGDAGSDDFTSWTWVSTDNFLISGDPKTQLQFETALANKTPPNFDVRTYGTGTDLFEALP